LLAIFIGKLMQIAAAIRTVDDVRIYNRGLSPAEIQIDMGTPVP